MFWENFQNWSDTFTNNGERDEKMTTRDYEILKRINPRIRKYERKENDVNQIVSEFSCSVEYREFLEDVLKRICEAGHKAEIIEVKNEKIYFEVRSNNEFLEGFLEKVL